MTHILRATKLSAPGLAFTNLAYVHPEVYEELLTHSGHGSRRSPGQALRPVQCHVGSIVLGVMPEPLLQKGDIGLSTCHRDSTRLQLGDAVHVRVFIPPTPKPIIGLMQIEVSTYLKPAERICVKDDVIEEDFRTSFCGQNFTVGQSMARRLGKETLKLTVLQMIPVETTGDKRMAVCLGSTGVSLAHPPLAAAPVSSFAELSENSELVFAGDSEGRVYVQSKKVLPSPLVAPDFSFQKLGIGGLDRQFSEIFRRAFSSRVFPPHLVEELGLKHVKGLMLYGPPGTGKTLIARQIGRALKAREPKVVNGPEILNKFVGQSEENVRALFKEAEEEEKKKGAESGLHILIFDELDAICKQRGANPGGAGVTDSVVNQLLSKIDGVNALNNILLIGMTNRIDLIDEALLRPGRFEVLIEIGLPDEKGRQQILMIHTQAMQEAKRLDPSVDLAVLAEITRNFSGAELEGLVRSAASFAFQRAVDLKDLSKPADASAIKITMQDFENALEEVKPAFGSHNESLSRCTRNGIICFSEDCKRLQQTCLTLGAQARDSPHTPVLSLLLHGPPGSGKTALAASVAKLLGFPFTKLVTAESWVGLPESARVNLLNKAFQDAYKSDMSLVLLDDLERLVDYTPIGPRFSNAALQALVVLVKKQPPREDGKLMIIGTTSEPEFIKESGIAKAFNVCLEVPPVRGPKQIGAALRDHSADRYCFPEAEIEQVCMSGVLETIPIKQLLMVTEMAAEKCKPGKTRARLGQFVKPGAVRASREGQRKWLLSPV
ncbi:n-ethylmaleimide-sensitive fusion [Cyclospora cayetanensis]|uniref:Vesicle-fusing ATPase n=1 Tax=Cyclospora cayetanensis TaxID=88456 RepID=A0A1D3D2C5_9EIME|nr:n-ethylmaleimide-sensitive fusion [Cyclospora cayetanensis]